MAVSEVVRYTVPVVSDGVQTLYTYDFRVLNETYLAVYGNDTLLPPNSYNVLGINNPTGGSVQFSAPIPVGQEVQIFGVTPRSQQIIYQEGDTFPAASHENGLDRGTMVDLEIESRIELAPAFPPTIPLNLRNMVLTPFAGHALKLWQINATEDGITYADSTILQIIPDPVSGMAYAKSIQVVDAVAGEALIRATGIFPAGTEALSAGGRIVTDFGTVNGLSQIIIGDETEGPDWWCSGMGIAVPAVSNTGQSQQRRPVLVNNNARDVIITASAGGPFDAVGQIRITAWSIAYIPD